jgi:protein TonB
VTLALRWLPLSLAVHAAALGGAVWLARGAADSALFIDLTLEESRGEDARPAAVSADAPRARPATLRGRPGAIAAALRAAPSPLAAPPARIDSEPPTSPPPVVSPPVSPPPPAMPSAVSAPPALPPAVAVTPPAGTPSLTGAESADAPATAPAQHTTGPGAGAASGTVVSGAASDDAGVAGRGDGGSADGRVALAVPAESGGGAYGPYLAALRRRIQESLAYPAAARRRGISGTVHLEILLEPSGVVSDVLVVRSSSHALLDDAAVDAVRGLGRMPFPAGVRPRALRVRLPVVFELR